MNDTIEPVGIMPSGGYGPNDGIPPLILSRRFGVSRERMWRSWTEPDCLTRWFAPKGGRLEIVRLDIRGGGTLGYAVYSDEAVVFRANLSYKEVVSPERLLFVTSFSERRSDLSFAPDLPHAMLCMITFSEHKKHTSVTLRVQSRTSDNEQETLTEPHTGLRQYWMGTLDQLGGFLAKD